MINIKINRPSFDMNKVRFNKQIDITDIATVTTELNGNLGITINK